MFHFGVGTFVFLYGRTRKPHIFMVSRFLDVPMIPKTNSIYRWRHQDTSNYPIESIWRNWLVDIVNLITRTSRTRWKGWGLTSPKMRRILEKLEYGIDIFQMAWNGNLVICHHFSIKKNLLFFCRFFESLILWYFEAVKPGNQQTNKLFICIWGYPHFPQLTDAHPAPVPL